MTKSHNSFPTNICQVHTCLCPRQPHHLYSYHVTMGSLSASWPNNLPAWNHCLHNSSHSAKPYPTLLSLMNCLQQHLPPVSQAFYVPMPPDINAYTSLVQFQCSLNFSLSCWSTHTKAWTSLIKKPYI